MQSNSPIIAPIIPQQFNCSICNYITSYKKDYTKHLLTAKHIKASKCKSPQCEIKTKDFKCDCGKAYSHYASLWKHKNDCKYIDSITILKEKEKDNIVINKDVNNDMKEFFINQSKQMMEMMVKQQEQSEIDRIRNQKLIEAQQEKTEIERKLNQQILEQTEIERKLHQQLLEAQQKQLADIIPKIGNNNNNTIKTTTKTKFNLKIFLNETCKEAITMTEFINRFEVTMQNILLLKDKGLVEAVTQAFIENMNKLSITERPIHCTDKKRERLYIKNDTWELDEDNSQIKQILKKLNHKQLQSTELWTDANPDFMTEDNLQDEFVKLIGNCTTSFEGKENKIIRNICEHIYLNEKWI